MDRKKLEMVLAELTQVIARRMSSVGLYYQIIGRVKSDDSLKIKLKKKIAEDPGYRLQDLIGIRIVVYFADDVEVVSKSILSDFELINTSIDEIKPTEITAIRNNYVYAIPAFVRGIFSDGVENIHIDKTFELQIRTINSECWHELHHDYIYKATKKWENINLTRQFHSILTAYEVIENSTLDVFKSMCKEFFDKKDVLKLIKYKFRIRVVGIGELPTHITKNPDVDFLKVIYDVDRNRVLMSLLCIVSDHEPELELEDLLNQCLNELGMEKIFNTNLTASELTKELSKGIENYNPILGTIHDEHYLEYREFIEGLDEDKPVDFYYSEG